MKHTLFFSMLVAALMGGQMFAEDYILTAIEGYSYYAANHYIGVYNVSDVASGGNVIISSSSTGSDFQHAVVLGGVGVETAVSNKITMRGGQVATLEGGEGNATASENTVIMTGGKANNVRGGDVVNNGFVEKNVVIVAGNCEISSSLTGGHNNNGDAKDNKVYLVGEGASATISDAQGNTATYTGGEISLNNVSAGRVPRGASINNSIDIYGTSITASGAVDGMQILNFHIAEALAVADAPMIELTSASTSNALNLTGVELGICGEAVKNWSAFDGKSITLVDATKAITVDWGGSLKDVDIKAADGAVIATAALGLANEGKSLVMSNIKGTAPVPEPTTGTLSLLALAGLCARRHKK